MQGRYDTACSPVSSRRTRLPFLYFFGGKSELRTLTVPELGVRTKLLPGHVGVPEDRDGVCLGVVSLRTSEEYPR